MPRTLPLYPIEWDAGPTGTPDDPTRNAPSRTSAFRVCRINRCPRFCYFCAIRVSIIPYIRLSNLVEAYRRKGPRIPRVFCHAFNSRTFSIHANVLFSCCCIPNRRGSRNGFRNVRNVLYVSSWQSSFLSFIIEIVT